MSAPKPFTTLPGGWTILSVGYDIDDESDKAKCLRIALNRVRSGEYTEENVHFLVKDKKVFVVAKGDGAPPPVKTDYKRAIRHNGHKLFIGSFTGAIVHHGLLDSFLALHVNHDACPVTADEVHDWASRQPALNEVTVPRNIGWTRNLLGIKNKRGGARSPRSRAIIPTKTAA